MKRLLIVGLVAFACTVNANTLIATIDVPTYKIELCAYDNDDVFVDQVVSSENSELQLTDIDCLVPSFEFVMESVGLLLHAPRGDDVSPMSMYMVRLDEPPN